MFGRRGPFTKPWPPDLIPVGVRSRRRWHRVGWRCEPTSR